MKILFLACLLTMTLAAESSLEMPVLGVLRNDDGTEQTIRGIAGNFALGEKRRQRSQDPGEYRKPMDLSFEGATVTLRVAEDRSLSWELRAAPDRVQRIAEDWVYFRTASASYLLRIKAGSEQIYVLPAADEEEQ